MFYTAPEVEREVTRRDKKRDWEAGKRVRNCEYKNMIDSPMIHHEIMQLRNRLPAFLQLSLQATQNMIKSQPALPRRPDAPATHTYPTKTLRLHRGSITRIIRAEGEAGGTVQLGWAPAGSRGDGRRRGRLVHAGMLCVLLLLMMIVILLELLLLLHRASGDVGVLIGEDAYAWAATLGWLMVLLSWPMILMLNSYCG
jgi:hypothetical protein